LCIDWICLFQYLWIIVSCSKIFLKIIARNELV
jgi:hypothetical protein